jgi:hypothetical protein
MIDVVVAVAWLVVGAAVGVIEGRHGHWHKAWVVSAILGPFAIPLALQHRHGAQPQPSVLSRGRARRGPIDLLIGLDGSESSMSAASLALRLFGPRVRRVTLATVLDVDTAAPHADDALYPEPWPEERAAREQLESAAAALAIEAGDKPGSVILAGDPADALEQLRDGRRLRGDRRRVPGQGSVEAAARQLRVQACLPDERPGVAHPRRAGDLSAERISRIRACRYPVAP